MFEIQENNWNFIDDEKIEKLNKIYEAIDDFFPREDSVLRFLNADFNKLKYVIVGMEPYPTSFLDNNVEIPEATGRSFEVASLKSWQSKFKQSSLRNILKTIYLNYTGENASMEKIRSEIAKNNFAMKEPKEWFDSMEKQGVLFLNATLTVKPYNVDSHTRLWGDFMNDLIKHIESNQDVTWLLWGAKAQQRVMPLIKNSILSVHPRLPEFVKQNCFKEANLVDWRG